MIKKAAKPKKVEHSDTLERLLKLNRNFAVRPAGFDNERWADRRVSRKQEDSGAGNRKKLIRDADKSINGVEFPAREMAQIIRGWLVEEE